MHTMIETHGAPAAIGSYSQAIKSGQTVYLSGQIGLNPTNMTMAGEVSAQVDTVFKNLKTVAEAAGGNLDSIAKLTVYLIDLKNIGLVNEAIKKYFKTPYPARTSVQVVALPKDALVEVDAIMVLK